MIYRFSFPQIYIRMEKTKSLLYQIQSIQKRKAKAYVYSGKLERL